jgi:hypothetical protein
MRTSRGSRTGAAALAVAALLAVAACTAADGGDDGGAASPTTSPGTSPTTAEPSPTTSGPPSGSPTASPTGGDDGGDGGDDTSGDEPTGSAPPFAANTEPDTAEPGGAAMLTVTDVRVGTHEGYDRVVFDLGGSGTPGWRVEYVDEAIDDGSGNPVAVDGEAILQVVISGTAMPADSGVEEYDGDTIDPDDTEAVEQVVYRFWFEGYTTSFIGVEGERKPFRVFSLTDPARVVVDVEH